MEMGLPWVWKNYIGDPWTKLTCGCPGVYSGYKPDTVFNLMYVMGLYDWTINITCQISLRPFFLLILLAIGHLSDLYFSYNAVIVVAGLTCAISPLENVFFFWEVKRELGMNLETFICRGCNPTVLPNTLVRVEGLCPVDKILKPIRARESLIVAQKI